jgi:hypothetical protein
MMRYYVTLFDSNYLTRGLTLYSSLMRHAEDFHLWIICFDDLAHQLLSELKLTKVTLVSLEQFEDKELLRIKTERTRKEYCWTCTPSSLLYVLDTEPQVDAITYLDADLMFFASPEILFEAAGQASILLTEHRYIPELQQQAIARGIYNVQFIMFRRDESGLKALHWWRDRCNEWCFDRIEENKFGDQKYLDDWTQRFEKVHVVQHLGAGLAPWNANQYQLKRVNTQIYVEDYPLIFYHFHGLSIYRFNIGYLRGGYPISSRLKSWVYQPYFQEIACAYHQLAAIYPQFSLGSVQVVQAHKQPVSISRLLKFIFREMSQGQFLNRLFKLPIAATSPERN